MKLTMEIHDDGRMFIEIDSLIDWFKGLDGLVDGVNVGRLAAFALVGMKERALKNPTMVQFEGEKKE